MTRLQRSWALRGAELVALWAYGVSQPVFSMLHENPELLIGRDATRLDITVFALLLAFGPPGLALLVERLVSLISTEASQGLHLAFVLLFFLPVAGQLSRIVDPGGPDVALLVALAVSVLGAVAYVFWRPIRMFLAFSVVLPLVGVLAFVFGAPLAAETARAADVTPVASPPIFMLVLDELAASSLLTPAGEIDAVRYPSFARLARDGTWYPNASTVHSMTAAAVPAILTGRTPDAVPLPIVDRYPGNLFTLLASAYAIHAAESSTRLCPAELCRRDRSLAGKLDGLLDEVGLSYVSRVVPSSIGRQIANAQLEEWVADLTTTSVKDLHHMLAGLDPDHESRVLYFSHLMLPHAPWRYLPSGREYPFSGIDGLSRDEIWVDDEWQVAQAFQRHLLQVGYTDAVLGRVLDRLDEVGLYDSALVVVVADHGLSFDPGEGRRRPLTAENFADIANVPLFVKYPGQDLGAVDERSARTIDILPTIADVLGVQVPWRVDGGSLLDPAADRAEIVVGRSDGTVMRAPFESMARRREATVARKADLFGEGRDSLFRIGSTVRLLGTAAPSTPVPSRTMRARLDDQEVFENVDASASFVPARVRGIVEGLEDSKVELAVAVNGRIRALTRVSRRWGPRFRALVPESAFRDGFNRVDVFVVRRRHREMDLVWLGSNAGT